jgi:hypothetical protein
VEERPLALKVLQTKGIVGSDGDPRSSKEVPLPELPIKKLIATGLLVSAGQLIYLTPEVGNPVAETEKTVVFAIYKPVDALVSHIVPDVPVMVIELLEALSVAI